MIDAQNLSKAYGDVQALDDVSFEVKAGEIVGLLGPNGAGKTTAIKILTGFLQPDEGTVTIDGLDVLTHTLEVQARIGYLPENAPLYPELSVQKYLMMMADLRQIPQADRIVRLSEAVHATSLTEYLTRPIGTLSKGLRQRVGLAQAILHQPRLLILDEPTVGLDPTQIVEIRRLIQRLSKRSTILFSTHILPEVEALCDRVLILMNGQVRADARLSELEATSDAILVLQNTVRNIEPTLLHIKGVRDVEPTKSNDGFPAYRILGTAKADLTPAVYALARDNNWPLRELRRDVRTLETVFNQLATTAAAETPEA
ncbi:MAG: ATP-binding cassette domain-containing protein [Thermoflexales bacterium]|nr:ATP-binding cassette domain-containing protein [Thermoflexales bacterium]